MNVGTAYFFDSRNRQMGNLSALASRLQEQISTGKRILAPSVDPLVSARLARIEEAVAFGDERVRRSRAREVGAVRKGRARALRFEELRAEKTAQRRQDERGGAEARAHRRSVYPMRGDTLPRRRGSMTDPKPVAVKICDRLPIGPMNGRRSSE